MTSASTDAATTTQATRVLVVDDVAVYRIAIKHALGDCAGLDVVGTAKDGVAALDAIRELRPDILTLDLDMPRLDGLGVLAGIAKLPRSLRPQVLVFAAPGPSDADLTVAALAAGAADVILKPTSAVGEEMLADQLVPRLRAMAERRPPATVAIAARAQRPRLDRSAATVVRRCLLIASSTGGPQALRRSLSTMPSDFPAPVFAVQHIPATFAESLTKHLDEICPLRVTTARDGEVPQPGTVYFPPGDRHLLVIQREGIPTLKVDAAPPITGLRPAADHLFTSAAEVYTDGCVASVFTGMGQDGLAGCRAIAARGGLILTQTADSCVVYGMPRAVDAAGLAATHFTPDEFASLVGGLTYA